MHVRYGKSIMLECSQFAVLRDLFVLCG